MPSYKTHVSVNLLLGLPLSLVALKYQVLASPPCLLLFSGGYFYGTLFLHPDVDLARNIRLFSWKGLFTLPFRPYSYLFHHRGISHMPILGTMTRLVWLIGCIWLFCFAFDLTFPEIMNWDKRLAAYMVGGLAIADLFHLLMDSL